MKNKARDLPVLAFCCASVTVPHASAVHADSVDDYVRQQMDVQHIPAVSIAVVKSGKTVKRQGYGLANMELNVPATPDSVFLIGSVSKQIIATGVMLLVNDGKLSLDDKAVKFLEGAPAAWDGITIRHLLTHTGGLIRESPAFAPLKVQSDAETIKAAYGAALLFKTGERWEYSNLGYFTLAEIIAKVSGKPWPQVIDERIFTPLGMDASTSFSVTPVVPNRVDGYAYIDGGYRHAQTFIALRPSGAFMSSVNDLLKWDAALDAAKLLPKTALEQMWTPVKLSNGETIPYGFGFTLTKLSGHDTVGHGGALPGFRAAYLRVPDQQLSVIVLANADGAASDVLAANIAMQYLPELREAMRVTRLAPAALDAVAGTYRMANGNKVSFAREGAGLRFNAPSMRMNTLLVANSATEFFAEADARIRVVFDRSASAVGVKTLMDGKQQGSGTRETTDILAIAPPPPPAPTVSEDARVAAFKTNDKNSDGKLDKAEYSQVLQALNAANQLDTLWLQRDANKDGFVSEEEYAKPLQ